MNRSVVTFEAAAAGTGRMTIEVKMTSWHLTITAFTNDLYSPLI